MDEIFFLDDLETIKLSLETGSGLSGAVQSELTETSIPERLEYCAYFNVAVSGRIKTLRDGPNVLTFGDDFDNFLTKTGVFTLPSEGEHKTLIGGTRILIQRVEDSSALSPGNISLTPDQYERVFRHMNLPFRHLRTTSVVGPLFWWRIRPCAGNGGKEGDGKGGKVLQMIFRKADVAWGSATRGREIILSFEFSSGITSGYIRASADDAGKGNRKKKKTVHAENQPQAVSGRDWTGPNQQNINSPRHSSQAQTNSYRTQEIFNDRSDKMYKVVRSAETCLRLAHHPFLIPILFLADDFSKKHDMDQRAVRGAVRSLETDLSNRYGHVSRPTDNDVVTREFDRVSWELAEEQCKAMWKHPQAWRPVAQRMQTALDAFWTQYPEDLKTAEMSSMHFDLVDQVEYVLAKLDGLESYINVSLERLNIQRDVMQSFIDQKESRLNLEIAVHQNRLADESKKESTSMKTLTILGAVFLPGAFLSSMFSMSFFKFEPENGREASRRFWIYVVCALPLTIMVIGLWQILDQRANNARDEDIRGTDQKIDELEARIVKKLGERLMLKVQKTLPPSEDVERSTEASRTPAWRRNLSIFSKRGSIQSPEIPLGSLS